MNVPNILQEAKRCGIEDTWSLILNPLYAGYKSCKDHTKSLMAKSPAFRKVFLTQYLLDTMDQQKMDNAKQIKEIIRREAHKKEWQGIHCVTKPNKTSAVSHVDVPLADSLITRYSKMK